MHRFSTERHGPGLGRGRNRIAVALLTIALGVPASARTATHNIAAGAAGFSFNPNDLTINVGDTVIWTSGPGSHTVTNGTGSADPTAGTLFDAGIGGFDPPTFQHTFTSVGVVPYYCRPHEVFNMRGTIRVQAPTSTPSAPALRATLSAPYPNPFNPRTALELSLPSAARVFVGLYDTRGRQVAALADGNLPAGRSTLTWMGDALGGLPVGSGVYLTRLVVDGREQPEGRHRLVLVR